MAAGAGARSRAAGVVATGVAALVLAGGCGGDVLTVEEFQQEIGVAAPEQPDPGSLSIPERKRIVEERTGRPVDWPALPVGFGDGEALVAAGLDRLPGERTLLQVVLSEDGYGIVTSQAARDGTVERVVVRDLGGGSGSGSGRIPVPSAAPTTGFRMDEVRWTAIPTLVDRTAQELGAPVTHVIVERNTPSSDDVVIRVYTATGRIDHRAGDGSVLRAYPG